MILSVEEQRRANKIQAAMIRWRKYIATFDCPNARVVSVLAKLGRVYQYEVQYCWNLILRGGV